MARFSSQFQKQDMLGDLTKFTNYDRNGQITQLFTKAKKVDWLKVKHKKRGDNLAVMFDTILCSFAQQWDQTW